MRLLLLFLISLRSDHHLLEDLTFLSFVIGSRELFKGLNDALAHINRSLLHYVADAAEADHISSADCHTLFISQKVVVKSETD